MWSSSRRAGPTIRHRERHRAVLRGGSEPYPDAIIIIVVFFGPIKRDHEPGTWALIPAPAPDPIAVPAPQVVPQSAKLLYRTVHDLFGRRMFGKASREDVPQSSAPSGRVGIRPEGVEGELFGHRRGRFWLFSLRPKLIRFLSHDRLDPPRQLRLPTKICAEPLVDDRPAIVHAPVGNQPEAIPGTRPDEKRRSMTYLLASRNTSEGIFHEQGGGFGDARRLRNEAV